MKAMRVLVFLPILLTLEVHGLWPIPKSLQTGTTALKLSDHFDIKLDIQHPPQDLLDAISRTQFYLVHDKLQVSNITPLKPPYTT
jgi:hexosaminidase